MGENGTPKDNLLNRHNLLFSAKDNKVEKGSKIADFETTQFMDGPLWNVVWQLVDESEILM